MPTATLEPSTIESLNDRAPVTIQWYRCKLSSELHKELHTRSDWKGFVQSAGYLAIFLITATISGYLAYQQMWGWFAAALLLHGTNASFMINAVHELTHGTVFKTKRWNVIFGYIFAWIGWINHEVFVESHARHHRYTLHDPDDSEVVLPLKVILSQFLLEGFVSPKLMWAVARLNIRTALGRFEGKWENFLFPAHDAKSQVPIRWSRLLLWGHLAVFGITLLTGWWWLFLIVSMTPMYGMWLLILLNNTQHIGLQDHVSDFRLCCRTITVNPFFQFIYWNMNFHIEHHMYAAVPCYNLEKLHRAIRHELPPISHGLLQTWIEIAYIQRMQGQVPGYQHVQILPELYPTKAPAKRA